MTKFARVIVSHPTGERELFKVRDRPNGDLIIALPKDSFHSPNPEVIGSQTDPKTFQMGQGTHHIVSERKYSVHRSLLSKEHATCIKQQLVSQPAGLTETTQYVHHAPGELFTAIFFKAPGVPQSQEPVKNGPAQTIKNICDYDPLRTTLFYALFVSEGWSEIPDIPGQVVLTFSHFTLHLYHTFIPFPSPPQEVSAEWITSNPRVNRGPIEHTHTDAKSLDPADLPNQLIRAWDFLRAGYQVFISRNVSGVVPYALWDRLSRQYGRKTPV